MLTMEEVQQEIIEEFSAYTDWMDKYSYLIEVGNELPTLDPAEKCDTYLIRGCQSRVWLVPENRDGLVFFRERGLLLSKGFSRVAASVVSGRTPRELLENPLHFIDEIGLNQHLSPTRANGLLAMVKQIRLYAVAYQRLEEK